MAAVGYSGKPLAQKLGLKPGSRLLAIAAPAHYDTLVGPDLATVEFQPVARVADASDLADLVHFFVPDRAALEAGGRAALDRVAPGGMLWVSWPKKTSAMFRGLTEDGIRDVLLPTGWVDVKVAAIDQDWSGLKFLKRRS